MSAPLSFHPLRQARTRARRDGTRLRVTADVSFYRARGKRWLDVALVAAAAPVVLPVIAVLVGLVRWRLGRPALFRQERPGLHGRPFTMLKLRTMRDAHDAAGEPLPDAERLTALGALLRRSSLDELPQLWNVVRGDMSLVGPRPLLMEYLARYTPEQARRHDTRPGITGWTQVNGRNLLSWEEKLGLDVWYVERTSLWLDVRILARTAWTVLRREGVSARGHATMPKFVGSADADAATPDVAATPLPPSTPPAAQQATNPELERVG